MSVAEPLEAPLSRQADNPAEEESILTAPRPIGARFVPICLIILAFLGTVYGLYLGRDLLMPLVIAAVLNLSLRPLMRGLHDTCRLPMPLAALLVIIVAFTIIIYVAYLVALPSDSWTARIPEGLAQVKQRLAFLAGPINYFQTALHNIESIGAANETTRPVVVDSGDVLPGLILVGTASTLRTLFVTILILYFMLASGDRMLRALIEVLPRFADKRRAVEIAAEIQEGVSKYLLTIFFMNALVGLFTGAAMYFCGLGEPFLWGALAFLLNFVPIVGPMMGLAMFLVAGMIILPWPLPALLPVALYALIHFVEGQLYTPHLMARRFELNPVLVIVSLLFWDSIWGVPGALLAVPVLAIVKILADRVDSLKNLGHLIGA